MTVDDIYRELVPSPADLWRELVSATEFESMKLDSLLDKTSPTFIRVSPEAFRLERDLVCVVVTQQPAGANWAQIKRSADPDTPSEKEVGKFVFLQGSVWACGQKIGPPRHAALILIQLLAGSRQVL